MSHIDLSEPKSLSDEHEEDSMSESLEDEQQS